MAGDQPTVSYVDSNTAGSYSTSAASHLIRPSYTQDWVGEEHDYIGDPTKTIREPEFKGIFSKRKKKEPKKGTKVEMRLVRYTVVDPDTILAREKPEASILLSGTVVVPGEDDMGLIMEISRDIDIETHNATRANISYETEKGEVRNLRSIKLGQVDIVIEVLKEYE